MDFGVNDGGGNGASCVGIKVRMDTTKLSDMVIASFGNGRNLKVRCSSKINPRLRAEWMVLSEESCILSSCFLSPMSKNSVLEQLRVRRLAVIQEEIC